MRVGEIAPGLWRWTAPHPAWTEADAGDWDREVGCVYCETEAGIVLIDPLVPSARSERQRFWRALDRDVERLGAPHVLVTCPAHARSSAEIGERYGSAAGAEGAVAGVVPFATAQDGETVYWLPGHGALVAGDVLLGDGEGGVRVCPDDWLDGTDHAALRASLAPLLELPVERILVSHGEPVLTGGRAALARALRDEC